MERLHKIIAEVETDEDPDFDNEDNGPEDVLEDIFSDHESFWEHDTIYPKGAADSVSSPSELWTVNNPRGGTNHKNSFYSARNLFKLALTAFGDPTCGVTKLTLQIFEMDSWDLFSAYSPCQ
ncbi:hypothetical protein AVEN_189111-1 [Araneus ventricosus]|uniref:Uncharacterized protein n=1 Tax=Araneus ventricosus TaxID=182803 RepID=A0A4Y2HG51_ARAVE|nr:hypothetical protein AVEN_189111-1 [Araneus ventricosus]